MGEAQDGQAAVDLAQELQPDVILMDIQTPRLDDLSATEQLRALGHPARVLLYSFAESATNVRAATQCGALGLVLKGGSREELIMAIRLVRRWKIYYSPAVARFFTEPMSR